MAELTARGSLAPLAVTRDIKKEQTRGLTKHSFFDLRFVDRRSLPAFLLYIPLLSTPPQHKKKDQRETEMKALQSSSSGVQELTRTGRLAANKGTRGRITLPPH